MIIKAHFRGTDSLGYVRNSIYIIDVKVNNDDTIRIRRISDNGGVCEYSSYKTFLSNWSNIIVNNTVIKSEADLVSQIRKNKIESL